MGHFSFHFPYCPNDLSGSPSCYVEFKVKKIFFSIFKNIVKVDSTRIHLLTKIINTHTPLLPIPLHTRTYSHIHLRVHAQPNLPILSERNILINIIQTIYLRIVIHIFQTIYTL